MADVIRIWVETSYNTAFRCGGWAWVMAEGKGLSGAAGGERTPSTERIALAGLADALKAARPGAEIEIHSSDALLIRAPRRIAGVGDPPYEDLDYWAPVTAALKTRQARFASLAVTPRTPAAFAAAWAELARDKAKSGGAFRSAIPKTNLAKAGVPA